MTSPIALIARGVALALVPALAFAQPAPTASAGAILAAAQKIVSDKGIDFAGPVQLGGIEQWVAVRGRDRRNPILLMLHGGPGSPELPNRYLFEPPWEDYFTVVQWDQRGAGKTYGLNNPATIAPTMSEGRIEADTEALVTWLRHTYGKRKIFVLGHSWGSILGLDLASRHPEWLYAYIGIGQVIDTEMAEAIGYQATLGAAQRDHNQTAIDQLRRLAPYPGSGPLSVPKVLTERSWSDYYGFLTHNRRSYAYWSNAQKLSPDYSAADLAAADQGSAFSLKLLAKDFGAANFTGLTHLACPVVLLEGRYDFTTPATLAKAWFDRLHAPAKRFVWFENSAHMVYAEEPGRVLLHLVEDARPIAERAGDAAPD